MVEMLVQNLPFLLGGAKNTFIVSVLGMVIALILGVPIGLMRLSKTRWVRSSALFYIEVWRGIPFIISLLFLYFALPEILKLFWKVEISQFMAMLLTCVLWTSANAAEIVRGAVQADLLWTDRSGDGPRNDLLSKDASHCPSPGCANHAPAHDRPLHPPA